jgi:hypothetical protein
MTDDQDRIRIGEIKFHILVEYLEDLCTALIGLLEGVLDHLDLVLLIE